MPRPFDVRDHRLYLGGCSTEDLAKEFGTPLYVYEEAVIREQAQVLRKAFAKAAPDFHFAMKANNNPALLRILLEEGMGIDAVAPFEVRLALEVGFPAAKVLFTGANVTEDELRYCLEQGVTVNVGSLTELERFGRLAPGGRVAVRVNPHVGAGHHHHVITGGKDSKFGIYVTQVAAIREAVQRHRLQLVGVHMHIGSGILKTDDMLEAMQIMLDAARQFPGLEFVDFGGGFGIPYRPGQKPLALDELGSAMAEYFDDFRKTHGSGVRMKLEPGRFLVAEAGTLLARVTSVKSTPAHTFVGTDSGFNHLIRPAFYGSYHEIANASAMAADPKAVVVAGNICESGDVFTQNADGPEDRNIPNPEVGHLLAICDAGAYGMVLSSQYNMRPRPPEVLVANGKARVIRRRETYEDVVAAYQGL
ncbi:MAG TPA: diaminopimelate decarboxylase [bacterium]